MKREDVDSSMIVSVGYDAEERILEVEFDGGKIYQYFDVPQEEYAGLMDAESKGQYMLGNIIDMYTYSLARQRLRSRTR